MLDLAAQEALEYQGRIDLLIVTATDIETETLERALVPLPGLSDVARTHIENHTYRLGRFGPFGAVHLQCVMGTRDAGSAMIATTEAARCWTPRAVLMPGIAWGSPREKGLGLGDVLVASTVQDFENVRIGDTYEFRSPETQAGPKLLDRISNVNGWQFILPDGRTSSRRPGLVLSGDKLIANAEFRDKLLNEFKRAIGGDMESYGVAQACRGLGLEWIVVKGVCDWGDENKNKVWQPAAAQSAVSLCVAALSHPSALHGLRPLVHADSTATFNRDASNKPPNEIPAATDRLVGRQAELRTLAGGLKAETNRMALCLVVGMGGVGKTFLAAEAARRLLSDGVFPDGVIWHATYEQSSTQVMAHVISVFGVDAASVEVSALLAAYTKVLRNRRVLIVVDNAIAASQVAPLITDSPGSAVLVTSRNHMPSLMTRVSEFVDLKTMLPGDAVDLLLCKAGALPPEQQAALSGVASLCGHLPLALSIAGGLLSEKEMWPSVQSLEKRLQKHRLDCLAIEGCPDLDVRAVLLLSYEQMSAALKRMFRSLTLLGKSSFGASAVSHMLDIDKDATVTDLARLIGRSILERSLYGRYVMHDLLRDLAQELLTSDEPAEGIVVLRRRAEAYWNIWHEALRLDELAAGSARRGDVDEAIEFYEKGRAFSMEIGERQGLAYAFGGIAAVWAKRGNPDKAIEFYEKALVLSKEIGDRKGEASTLGGIAAVWAKRGNPDKAIEFYEKALVLNREIGDRHGEASTLGGIAAAWAKRGNPDKAIEFYEKALVLNEAVGNRRYIDITLSALLRLAKSIGDEALVELCTSRLKPR